MSMPGPKDLMVGLDVGSTTVKSVVVDLKTQEMLWSDYQRHDTKQPEKCLEFLKRMEADTGIKAGETRIFITGSGGGTIAPHIGAKFVQEDLAVLTRGNTLRPVVLLLGGPNTYIEGMRDCWKHNIPKVGRSGITHCPRVLIRRNSSAYRTMRNILPRWAACGTELTRMP